MPAIHDYSLETISNPFEFPAYDTIIESSLSVSTTGGTLTFFQGGPDGVQVGQLTITIAGDGRRITQRTS